MVGLWLQDIEALEAISGDETTRALFLRIARLSQDGRLKPFLLELERDAELDTETKAEVAELARDPGFLHAVEDYVRRTDPVH